MKKKALFLAALLFILSTLPSFASDVDTSKGKVITIDEAVNYAVLNNLQIKISETETKIAGNKKEQAFSGYLPKLKLSGGVTHFNKEPDIVTVGNSLANLNNALDGTLDIMNAEQKNMYDYYFKMAVASAGTANEAAYKQLAGLYKQLSDKSAYVANLMSQKVGPDKGLDYYGIKLTLEQPLYTGGKLTAINAQAAANEKYTLQSSEISKQSIIFETKKAYLTAMMAKRMFETATEAVKSMEEHLLETKKYFEAGMVNQLDIIRAEVKLADLNQKLVTAKNGTELSKKALNFVIGQAPDTPIDVDETIVFTPLTESIETLQLRGLNNRPEVKQADAKYEMAKQNIEIASSDGKPMFMLTGEIGKKTTKPLEEKLDNPEWSVSIVGSYAIFDGLAVHKKVAEAENQTSQASSARQLISNMIKLEISQAYLNLQNAYENIETAKKGISLAEESVRLAKASYTAGLANSLDVIDSQVGLTQAKNNYTQAVIQYGIAAAQLQKATGGR